MITSGSARQDGGSDSERILVGVAHALAGGDPEVWRRLIEDHVPNGSGRCVSCRVHGVGGPHWPCTLRTVADAAREIAFHRPDPTDSEHLTTGVDEATPLALRVSAPAPEREAPEHRYDPVRQVAVSPDGLPLRPRLGKEWTTIPGTHTDGDGGDNEHWTWEES